MRLIATKEHQCRETENIVKQYKDLYDNFRGKKLYGGCTDNIVFFYIQFINHHTYI